MDVATQEAAFDQDSDYAVYQDLYGSLVDDSTYEAIAAQCPGGLEGEAVGYISHQGPNLEDTSMTMEHEAYINEASRAHYEEDIPLSIPSELLY